MQIDAKDGCVSFIITPSTCVVWKNFCLKKFYNKRNKMKVGIIGSGMVGATSAYAIMMRKVASDIVLIEANEIEQLLMQ
jgi:hypothetical protein